MQWFAQAPSNIALIKYMGKKEEGINVPSNPSLSYTLNHLVSSVELESQPGSQDFWEPLVVPGLLAVELSLAAQERYLRHLQLLKSYFSYSEGFVVRSSNNFPHSSGLASSASSFAALTKCAVLALSELTETPMPSTHIQANLSSKGSGSSCRSFFSPWVIWDEHSVHQIALPFSNLIHQVIIISHEEKKVSSGEAHQRVKTSKLYASRAARATNNLRMLLEAFRNLDWENAYHICWQEFQDMHQLFATASSPFSYITDKTKNALDNIQTLWKEVGDGPIVTMDAGPNIHLLYRQDQSELAQWFKQHDLVGNYDFL